MRVLVISDYRDTQAVRPEAELMLGLKARGIDIAIITFPGTAYEEPFREAGIEVLLTHPEKKYDRTFIKFLRKYSIDNEIELFYLFNSAAIINGILAAYSLAVKVILYRGYTGHIHWYDPTAYLKYLNPRVNKIVCLADSIRELLYRQKFFKKEKAVTINKGHHPDWYRLISPLSLSEFNIPEHAFVVACMANARPFKGIRYLLEATYLLEKVPELHLLLIGRDMNKGSLQDLISGSPLASRIHVTGWRKDVLRILASCKVFVLPSIGGEATTKSVIEAMSLGIAPIITDIPGNRDLVIDQECGMVVPSRQPKALADAITFYYNHRNVAQKHGQAARQHIQTNFHIQRTIEETEELFRELIR